MKKLVAGLFFVMAVSAAQASVDGYFMLSLFSPGQLPVPMTHLYGGRLTAFYGECQELFGLDAGGVGRVRERMYGAQIGLGHLVGTDASGLQLGLYEYVESEFEGCQIGCWTEVSGRAHALQVGLYDSASEDPGMTFAGCQIGVANFTGVATGCQIGIFNKAITFTGCQLGLVNWTSAEMKGCQIGLLNATPSQKWPYLPLVNVRW